MRGSGPGWRARRLLLGVLLVGALAVPAAWGGPAAWWWASAPLRPGGADLPRVAYPAPAGDIAVRLAVAGDVGTGEPPEWATAAAMDRLEATGEFDALVLLGDNIYPDGDVADVRRAVLDPFAAVLDGGTVLRAALGNHDVRTADGEPQLAALGMPGRWYATRLGPVELVVLDSTRPADPGQLRWLEATLAAARRDGVPFTVVAQHHPPLSAGYHGSHEPSRRHLVPIFERYGVDLVLAGHDHDYQRSAAQGGVVYVVSGGAATLRPAGSAEFTVASGSVLHFVEVNASDTRLELRAIDQQGRVLDAWTDSP